MPRDVTSTYLSLQVGADNNSYVLVAVGPLQDTNKPKIYIFTRIVTWGLPIKHESDRMLGTTYASRARSGLVDGDLLRLVGG